MLRSLKLLFAKEDDPYAGADLDLARRLGGMFWLVNAALAVALWPFSQIDRQIGSAGWLIGAGLVVCASSFAVALRSPRLKITFTGLLVSCYVGAAGIGVMQWLSDRGTAPYDLLLLNVVLLVAATNPLRRVTAFVAYVAVVLAAPLVYLGWDQATAAKVLAEFVIWAPLAFLVFLMMKSIRGQRLSLQREEQAARTEARLDGLTQIGNRRGFEEAIAGEISRSDRMGTPLTLAMGDIEHFKRINDEFGHLEGDQCLCRVAKAMESELRTPDQVFRWGGDEFVLLLPGTVKEDADVLIERVQNKVSIACKRPDNEPVWIHFAAAELRPPMTATDLTEAADLALMAERARDHRERA